MNEKALCAAYDRFVQDIAAHQSRYGEHAPVDYLTRFRPRLTAQVRRQLEEIEKAGIREGRLLSLGGWPGLAAALLGELTGLQPVLVDHPALFSPSLSDFYRARGLEIAPFDFARAAEKPLPVEGPFVWIECCQCIEHWNFSPVPLFRRVFRELLAPEGYFFVTVPNAVSLFRRLGVLLGRSPFPAMQSFLDVDRGVEGAEVAPHWREYTAGDLPLLAAHCGGKCVRLETRSYPVADESLPHRIYRRLSLLHPALRENIEALLRRA